MVKPYFVWKAILDDETEILQFIGDEETLFKEVEDAKDNLVKFRLEAEDGEYYEVDLAEGSIDCNGNTTVDLDIAEGEKAELIYSRRGKIRIHSVTGEKLDNKTIHRIGLKYGEIQKVVEVFPGLQNMKRKVEVRVNESEETEDITEATVSE